MAARPPPAQHPKKSTKRTCPLLPQSLGYGHHNSGTLSVGYTSPAACSLENPAGEGLKAARAASTGRTEGSRPGEEGGSGG